jgi:hypothetical protein
MSKWVMVSLFVMGVVISVVALVPTEASAQCGFIGGTRVCWGGGSGGEIALVEVSGRERGPQACAIVSGCPPGSVPGSAECPCPAGTCSFEGEPCHPSPSCGVIGIGALVTPPAVVTEIRARAFGTERGPGAQPCGFGGNELCDFSGVVCCGDQAAPQCRHATFDGPLFARIEGGPGQFNDSAPSFTALRLQPTQGEQTALCGPRPFVTANAGKFFGEVCVEDTNGAECVRQSCIGNLGLGGNGAIIYNCKQLPSP